MDAVELDINRKNTTAFIAFKPVSLALIPVVREKVLSGGWKEVDQPARPPQTFRIIELGATTRIPKIKTQDGVERDAQYWLLGEHDAAVGLGDHWTEGTRHWAIGEIIRTNEYETRCVVVERGR